MISFRGVTKASAASRCCAASISRSSAARCLFIIGTSGVGKSVTIKHLVGLLRLDGGEIWFDGQRVDQLAERALYAVRKRCAMVFQNATLFDSMTLAENVALPLRKHRGLSERDAEAEALPLPRQVHMREFADRYPAELGDGMRKRAAIARTLTARPGGRALRRADHRPRPGERAPHRPADPRARRRAAA